MQDEPWYGHVSYKGMNITSLSRTLRDAMDSFNQGVGFRDTNYSFDGSSLKSYICAVCKDDDNRRKLLKQSGALSKAFVAILQLANSNERFSRIIDAIKDEPDLKGLCEKIRKQMLQRKQILQN